MFKTKIKQKIITILTILASSALWASSTQLTNAKYDPQPRNLCSLAVFPFDASKPITYPAAINKLDDATCKKFLSYPNAYKNNPPIEADNPYAAGAEGQNAPITEHDHAYFNDSVQDDYYYMSAVDKFEITLQSDGYNSIDIDKITCGTPLDPKFKDSDINDIKDCDGNSPIWGGTTVTKKKTNDNTVVVTWDFAQTPVNGIYASRPKVYGNNGNNFEGINLTDDNNRKLPFYVKLTSKDNDKIWSATTTSRVLVVDMAIKKTNYNQNKGKPCFQNNVNDSQSGWCLLTPNAQYKTEQVFTDENKTFYWLPIGSVATVWREPATPPPKETPNICNKLIASFNLNTINLNNSGKHAYPMVVSKVAFGPEDVIPAGTELKWTSTDSNGQFWQDFTIYPDDPNLPGVTSQGLIGTGSVSTSLKQKVYYFGKPESVVTVTLDKIPAELIGKECKAELPMPAIPECKEILVDHPEHIYEGTYSIFKAKSLDMDYKDLNSKIKYSVTPGYGKFYAVKPSDYDSKANKSKQIYEATPADQSVPYGGNQVPVNLGPIDPNILIYGNNLPNSAKALMNLIPKISDGTIGIQDLGNNISDPIKLGNAVNSKAIVLQDWMVSGLPPVVNPPDPSPISTGNPSDGAYSDPSKFGQNNVLQAVAGSGTPGAFDKPGATYPKAFDATPYMNKKPLNLNIDPNKAIGNQNLDIDTNPGTQFKNPIQYQTNSFLDSIIVSPDTIVYFYAEKAGTDVIHVQTVGSDNPDCGKDYSIEAVCKSLNLSPVGPLSPGSTTAISVNPVDSLGKPLPVTTNIKFGAGTTGGTFQKSGSFSAILAAKVNEFPVNFVKPTALGTITVGVDPADPLYSAKCEGIINVTNGGVQQCTDLQREIYAGKTDGSFEGVKMQGPVTLEKGKKYKISSYFNTLKAVENKKVTYTIDEKYGSLYSSPDMSALDKKTSPLTVNENQAVYLLMSPSPPASEASPTINDVLKITAEGYPECQTNLKMSNPGGGNQNLCQSITLTPTKENFVTSVSNPNPTTFTIGNANNKDYKLLGSMKINIKSSISGENGQPQISKMNDDFKNEITFYHNELQTDPLQFKYKAGTFTYLTNSLDLTIKSFNPDETENPNCEPSIHYPIETKNCPEDQSKCTPGSSPTPPSIKKMVYPGNRIQEMRDDSTINIKKKDKYITYMIYFKPGDNIKDAQIWDATLETNKNGTISNTLKKTNGYLSFAGMSIEMKKGGTNSTLYKSGAYIDDEVNENKNSEFNDKNFSTVQNTTQDKNDCSKETSKPCIKDINSTSDSFKNGEKISFDHLSSLSTGDFILIKYQMEYKDGVYKPGSQSCKNLIKEKGCGEQFENEAKYSATSKTSNPETYSNKPKEATAKAIAVCPYILTRQGGDTFFHDVINTGVDVSQCYDVKNCEGPCIKPTPPTDQEVNKTGKNADGTAATTTITLNSATHDVCRASNLAEGEKSKDQSLSANPDDLKDYQNVLENFSSSICEMQADVAKAWTKQYITDSINANVKRISRFEKNLSGKGTSNSPLITTPDSSNGVFVTDGDLYINGKDNYSSEYNKQGNPGQFTIKSTNSTPSAQTYIVIGHDLHIQSNIVYENNPTKDFTTTYNKNDIASAAFIVIDGNIIIDSGVDHIDGILMAVDTDGKDTDGQNTVSGETDGQVRADSETPQEDIPLNINGNLIGNVIHLFTNRQFAGDPLKDEGSVNIHYDERILLNPPPGINELVNLQQVVVPN